MTDEFVLDGEVIRQGDLFETFRYRFERPVDQLAESIITLEAQRQLRPGAYEIRIRVEHLDSGGILRASKQVEVPIIKTASVPTETATPAPGGNPTDRQSITLSPPTPGLGQCPSPGPRAS